MGFWNCVLSVFSPVCSVWSSIWFVDVVVLHLDERFSNSGHPVYAFHVRMSPLFWHKLGLAFPGASMEFERIHVRTLVIWRQMWPFVPFLLLFSGVQWRLLLSNLHFWLCTWLVYLRNVGRVPVVVSKRGRCRRWAVGMCWWHVRECRLFGIWSCVPLVHLVGIESPWWRCFHFEHLFSIGFFFRLHFHLRQLFPIRPVLCLRCFLCRWCSLLLLLPTFCVLWSLGVWISPLVSIACSGTSNFRWVLFSFQIFLLVLVVKLICFFFLFL